MTERTHFTNFLLLSVLAVILLVSGSLQCAFDCLTQVDSLHSSFSLQAHSDRVDSCHPSIDRALPTASCLNKACHQRLPLHQNLGGPEIYHLEKMPQPLFSSSRQPSPQYRAGSAVVAPPNNQQTHSRLQATIARTIPQSLFNIRTTVILC